MTASYTGMQLGALSKIKLAPISWTSPMGYFNCELRKAFWRRIGALLCVTGALYGCNRSPTADSLVPSYEVRGIVRRFAPDRSTVSIEHEDIPGFMPSMTMPFTVKSQSEVSGLKIGDGISFRMTVTDKGLLLDQVKVIPAGDVHIASPTPSPSSTSSSSARHLKEGEMVPFFSLTNQDGAHVGGDTFRDRPYILTFVFTRCPVPNFCPRISQNFSQLQNTIKADAALASKARLLSITLDPKFDTPEILKAYAEHQQADPAIWKFATGEAAQIDLLTQAFAVYVEPEGGTISHGLATALIGPDGTVIKIWRGNAWTPAEIISELRKL